MSDAKLIEMFAPTLAAYCRLSRLPFGFCAGWILVESDGRFDEVTELDERGYFQVSPEESLSLGLDHQRLSVDLDYSLQGGLLLVNRYAGLVAADTAGTVKRGSEYFWRLVKFAHAYGHHGAKVIFQDAVLVGGGGASWEDFAAFARDKDDYYGRMFANKRGVPHPPARWLANVERVIAVGRQFGPCSSLDDAGPAEKPAT